MNKYEKAKEAAAAAAAEAAANAAEAKATPAVDQDVVVMAANGAVDLAPVAE